MVNKLTPPAHNHLVAVGYMITAVICISLTPLWIALSNGGDSPFLFNAVLRFDVTIVFGAYILASYRHFVLNREIMSILRKRIVSWLMAFTTIGAFDFAVFAWASKFVDISIVAILFEMWAIFIIFFMSWLYRKEQVYKSIDTTKIILLIIGFIGVAFVIASQSGNFDYRTSSLFPAFAFGICLAITGAIISAFAAFNFRWSTNISREITEKSNTTYDIQSLNLFAAVLAYALSSLLAAPISLFIGLMVGETTEFSSIVVILGGAFAQGIGSILWRKSNLLSDSPTINAIAYAIPILSLGWLTLFSLIGVARPDLLLIGAVAIVSTNFLINFESEIQFGFKSLILALWGCGTIVYLRDDLLQVLPFDNWLWPGEIYLGALALSATVFILLLSFRVARLAARTRDEDNVIFALFQNLDLLARRNLIDPSILEYILTIDGSHSPDELQSAYWKAKICLSNATSTNIPIDYQMRLAEAEAQLNTIVHSRRHGIEFGELFALIIFGGITVMLGLLSRPKQLSDWPGLMYEAFVASFCAVVVFLIVNVWDLQRDRTSRILHKQPGGYGYGVVFRDATNRRFEQSVSIIIGLAIAIAYVGLLWYKWMH